MPIDSIFEHSGTDEALDSSDSYESMEESDSSFFHPSHIQACHELDRHRPLIQSRELTKSKALHRRSLSQASAQKRFFYFFLFHQIEYKDIELFFYILVYEFLSFECSLV